MKFRKVVVIDNIIMFPPERMRLESLAEEVVWATETLSTELAGGSDDRYCVLPARNAADLAPILQNADAILTCWRSIDETTIAISPNLRYVGLWTNMWRHRINPQLVTGKQIHVDYLPDYGTGVVPEYVFAGLLEMARRPHYHYHETRRGSWNYELVKTGRRHIKFPGEVADWSLGGKNLGIVGLGRIGMRVAQIAIAFGMHVYYYSRTRKPEAETMGITYLPLDELCRQSDVLTLHVSADATRLVQKHHLAMMKDGAIVVNTANGSVIDQSALINELSSKRLSAFLDVYEGLPPRKELKDLPNVFFSYRAAWFTKASVELKGKLLLDRMQAFLGGQPHAGCATAEFET